MGSFIRHPLLVAAVVDEIVNRGLVNNKTAAFPWLEKRGWSSATAARDSYYRAWREERFKPVLIQDQNRARQIEEEEFNRAITGAAILEPGTSITHALAEFSEGPLTLSIESAPFVQ